MSRKDNIKALFTNTRTRIILIFTLALLLVTIIIGYIKLGRSTENIGTSTVPYTPPVRSIPGSMEQTSEYAKLQEEQNVEQAQEAERSGSSTIPTIIKTQAVGEGVEVIGAKQGEQGVGFATLSQHGEDEMQQGLWLDKLKQEQCSKTIVDQIVAQGATLAVLKKACSCIQLKDIGYALKEIESVCDCKELKAAGYHASDLKEAGYSAKRLKDCGFSACELHAAGFSAQEMKEAGFPDAELKGGGYSPQELGQAMAAAGPITEEEIRKAGCEVAALTRLREAGVSAETIKRVNGCSAAQLKAAGFTAAELKAAGFSADELKAAGFSPKELKAAGFDLKALNKAGFSVSELKPAGFTPEDFKLAGLGGPPETPEKTERQKEIEANQQRLQAVIDKQNQQMAEQKYQQQIQQKTSDMTNSANQYLQIWKTISTQTYTEGTPTQNAGVKEVTVSQGPVGAQPGEEVIVTPGVKAAPAVIKTGDVEFAVLDTSVNSDEPGPILATIVSGKLKGAKLIGNFNLPANAEKMVISFNSMSVPGAARTISISAYAIDPNTARTALSSRTDNHYLLRYGSLFASSFLQGFGNAFQAANTQVTIGGTGGGNDITIQNGIGRSTLQNAVIGLATVGKNWGQQAQQIFNKPKTVLVYSGTGIGVLFTQDVASIN